MARGRQVVQHKAKAADVLSIRPTGPNLHKDVALLCGKGLTTERCRSVMLPENDDRFSDQRQREQRRQMLCGQRWITSHAARLHNGSVIGACLAP